MRFEVEVDDGNKLATLNRAREAYNAANAVVPGFVTADDMPSFVQRLMDKGVADSIQPFGPVTLSDALAQIAALTAEKAALETEVAAVASKAAPIQ